MQLRMGLRVVAGERGERGQIGREVREGGGRGDEGVRQDIGRGRGRGRKVTHGATTVTDGGAGRRLQRRGGSGA